MWTLRSAIAGLLVLGCAAPPAVHADDATAPVDRVVRAMLEIGGSEIVAVWYLPAGDALALVTVQPGFTRDCGHLADTTRQFMERGLMALCLEAPMAGGNPALADALAAALLGGLGAPDGRRLPPAIVVAGHSAGAVFAVRLGWRLAQAAPGRVLGALLFDPVEAGDFSADLVALSAGGTRAVRAITANPGPCNAQHSAYPALRQVRQNALQAGRSGFVGLQLTDRSTHVDAEGDDSTALAVRLCRQGPPRRTNTTALRTLAVQWAVDLASDTRSAEVYPGGVFVERLLAEGQARAID